MKSWEVVAYAYDAAIHCAACAEKAGMTREHAGDSEGNPVTPVFAGDEGWEDESCDDCLRRIGDLV